MNKNRTAAGTQAWRKPTKKRENWKTCPLTQTKNHYSTKGSAPAPVAKKLKSTKLLTLVTSRTAIGAKAQIFGLGNGDDTVPRKLGGVH